MDKSIDTEDSEKHKSIEGSGYMQFTVVVVHQHTFCNLSTLLVMLPLRHAASLLPPSFRPAGLDRVDYFSDFYYKPYSTPTFPPLSIPYHPGEC